MGILHFLDLHSAGIAIFFSVIAGFWALIKYLETVKDKRFTTYHDLLDQLVNETRNSGGIIKLDRQIAIVFELKNFSRYFPVSIRILNGLKKNWAASDKRILEEIDLSLSYMKKNIFSRFFEKVLTKIF